ncbi:MAG: hypothetical protein H7Z15_05045 [Rhizobacter sp.]|nr:hypothetical protein [Rhizobacter sp.]
MSHPLESRRLYIADLARRQHEMESGRVAMKPLTYRVLSKCLREALAGLSEPAARAGFSELPAHLMPLVADVLETRHFDQHACLLGRRAAHCREQAEIIVDRVKRSAAC